MNLREDLITALIAAGISSPRLETDIILKHAAPNYPQISPTEEKNVRMMLQRRLNHEPLDKIIGYREFYKSTFRVSADVLSPRPETEILVERALMLLPRDNPVRILDLGTGSGCILLSLLKERPNAQGCGVDISAAALKIAAENADRLGVKERTEFICRSWCEQNFITGEFDLILSNPPYIPQKDILSLDPEVKDHDPLSALNGGVDGLKCYREIAAVTPLLLKKKAYILLEAGAGQDSMIAKIFTERGLTVTDIVPDLAGINRCVILKK